MANNLIAANPVVSDPFDKHELWSHPVFDDGVVLYNTKQIERLTPSARAFVPLIISTYDALCAKHPDLDSRVSFEMFQYYCFGLFHFRMIQIKEDQHDSLEKSQRALLKIFKDIELVYFEPITLYLSSFGSATTMSGELTYVRVPPQATERIEPIPALYGPILNSTIHNLYIEVPVMGVAIERLMHSTSLAEERDYDSVLNIAGLTVNRRLLGYDTTSAPREELRSFFSRFGITQEHFPETLENSGIHVELIQAISALLAHLEPFKVRSQKPFALTKRGAPAQFIVLHPENPDVDPVLSTAVAKSAFKESRTNYGVSCAFAHQLRVSPTYADQVVNVPADYVEGDAFMPPIIQPAVPAVPAVDNEPAIPAQLAVRAEPGNYNDYVAQYELRYPGPAHYPGNVEHVIYADWNQIPDPNAIWSCLNFTVHDPITYAWIIAANNRRIAAPRMEPSVFRSIPSDLRQRRLLFIDNLMSHKP